MMKMRTYIAITLAMTALLAGACSGRKPEREPPAPARTETAQHGPVSVTMTVTPGAVTIDRHVIFSFKAVYPSNTVVEIPVLTDRFEGFAPGNTFDRTSSSPSGESSFERIVRLTPAAAGEYRIAPIPVVYQTSDSGRIKKAWFPTPPIQLEKILPDPASATFKDAVDPVWVRPSPGEILLYISASLLLILLIILSVKLIGKAVRHVHMLRLSPRDRALHELKCLLQKDLVGRNMVKDFYLELTMIVRLFIERGYCIRAPEQTTEEFLASASADARFTPDVLAKLRAFLQSADLVKFAGFMPDRASTDRAVSDAEAFIKVESSSNPDTAKKQEVDNA